MKLFDLLLVVEVGADSMGNFGVLEFTLCLLDQRNFSLNFEGFFFGNYTEEVLFRKKVAPVFEGAISALQQVPSLVQLVA